MGIQELQKYIEVHAPNACIPVDLLKLARGVTLRQPRTPSSRLRPPPAVQLCLVLDAESCLDRLYGGFFSDWVCGGQWNRMVQFLSVLVQTMQNNNMEMAVYFSGALELPRMREWVGRQYAQRRHINQTLKHVTVKATPPPKIWWTAPPCLRTALRMALRHLKVQVLCSVEEHRQEVMAFCREHSYHGVMAEDAEYIMFNPPRFFSAKQMKLTYKGALETKEFIMHEVARRLDLQPNRFCLLAALLGNFMLTDDDLADFHEALLQEKQAKGGPQTSSIHFLRQCPQAARDRLTGTEHQMVGVVVEFVRSLPSVDDLDTIGARVFGAVSDPRVKKLKESVAYFVDGSRDGYFKYKPLPGGQQNGGSAALASERDSDAGDGLMGMPSSAPSSDPGSVPGIAPAPAPAPALVRDRDPIDCLAKKFGLLGVDNGFAPCTAPGSYNGVAPPINGHMDMRVEGPLVTLTPPPLPSVIGEVLRTAAERHQKGLMSPWVYQVLTKGELKIPVCVEDELERQLPNSTLFYRPVRERIYGVLFNLYHHAFLNHRDRDKPDNERHAVPDVQVREWAYSRNNPFTRPDMVAAKPLGWGVPTVQRLWFGTTEDDKKRRLRAFLTCLQSDSPMMRSTVYVPQHLLILACVLRYMMSQGSANDQSYVFKPELDAFIAQALCPKLTDSHYLQELQLPAVTPRGVQLANMFMQGVETALFANDACGSPVPWLMCCPWLFFDGKLFHSYLLKATQSRNVTQLCDNRAEMVAQLEMTRQAVLDGLRVQYGRSPLAANAAGAGMAGAAPEPPLDRRGGRLEIGGVVVGSWAGAPSGGVGRGAGLLPAGMHHPRQLYGRSGLPQIPAGRPYAPSGKPGKKHQGRRKAGGRDGEHPSLLPLGRAMTVDTSDVREVGDPSLGGANGDAAGQFLDAPLLHAQ